jgi:hypothetical protein
MGDYVIRATKGTANATLVFMVFVVTIWFKVTVVTMTLIQRFMGNSIIIVSPHNFEHLYIGITSCRKFGSITFGIFTIP